MPRLRTVAVKPWWKSRIIWTNVISLTITALTAIAERSDILPENSALVVTTITAILNIILRTITISPVSLHKP